MKRTINIFLLFIFSVFLSGCTLFPGRKKSALSVSTTPKATIFLDGEHLGSTPYYNEKLKSGEYVLKIVPESSGQALNPWEGRITLSPGILTVVNRELGLTQDVSSGEILSFEPLADKNATSISVVTTPDGAVVNLDGEPKGFAPLSIDSVSEGDHILVISSPGFQEKTIKAKIVKGNKLIASVQLARELIDTTSEASDEDEDEDEDEEETEETDETTATPEPSSSPDSSPEATSSVDDPERPYVEINSPDVGWVRVRDAAGTHGEELTKVDHGEKFPLNDTDSGWYQIEYNTGKYGWISGKYAEKFE